MSPGQIDVALVRRHLMALDAAVQGLRRHAGRAVDLLRSDVDEAWIVERGLQLAAQNALDIATHVAASAGRDVPDYASAIDALAGMRILPPDFAARFRSVAGFRNVLVHGYLAVDPDILHRLVNERLDDFVVFAAHIERHLGEG